MKIVTLSIFNYFLKVATMRGFFQHERDVVSRWCRCLVLYNILAAQGRRSNIRAGGQKFGEGHLR